MLFYPLYCGNIAETKAAGENTHDVDTWIEGSQAQVKNVKNRDDFKMNLLVLGSKDKYTKSGVDCVRKLVSESRLQELGYPIHREGEKVMLVIGDKIMSLSYENDTNITKNAKTLRTG